MTAEGKITAANLREGSRIMVSIADNSNVFPSPTKRKDAYVATVQTITRNPAGTSYESPGWVEQDGEYVRGIVRRIRRRSDFDIVVQIDRDTEPHTLVNVTPSQTFWLAKPLTGDPNGCPVCGSNDTEHTPGEGCSYLPLAR